MTFYRLFCLRRICRPTCINVLKLNSRFVQTAKSVLETEETLKSPKGSLRSEHCNVNKYTTRTFTCGELRLDHVGQKVTLCGWLEYQRMNKFVVLRDSYGETQVIIQDEDIEMQKSLENIAFESILQVKGIVVSRPKEMINNKQATGEIEVVAQDIKILNGAMKNLPFNIREFQKAKEALRMKYRYLDLRFSQMQYNLRLRSEILMKMREFLIKNCFVDVETPTLFKATPGGAQEFIVPTRYPGQFYSLVQSPQQFKQMLMAGAIDRYFQIARCYRDETTRWDRQPEFTQLDIELSFTSLNEIVNLIEELLNYCWPQNMKPLSRKFDRITYKESMEYYGSDQPDTRHQFKLKNCSSYLTHLNKSDSEKDFGAYILLFPKPYNNLQKSLRNRFTDIAETFSNCKLVQSKILKLDDWIKKIEKLIPTSTCERLINDFDIKEDSILFLTYGKKDESQSLLGKIRVDYINELENPDIVEERNQMKFLWVTDFPLFEESEGKLKSAHHPFTSPNPEDLHLLHSDPLKVRSLAYDLVLNGNEVGGGSIRIHNSDLQAEILDMLDIDKTFMSHILQMLESGCPPHGGIALGLDRLMAKICKSSSIKDVIAFPKTFEGRDPLSGAPSAISDADKELYHIKST